MERQVLFHGSVWLTPQPTLKSIQESLSAHPSMRSKEFWEQNIFIQEALSSGSSQTLGWEAEAEAEAVTTMRDAPGTGWL